MAVNVREANLSAILAAGRRLAWGVDRDGVSATNEAPGSVTSGGMDARGAVAGRAILACRRDPSFREARIAVGVYVGTDDYDLNINGTTVQAAAASHATAGELLEALLIEVINDSTTDALVEADLLDADGDVTVLPAEAVTLRLRGKAIGNYYVNLVGGSTTGTLTGTIDAVSATARAWFVPDGDGAPETWAGLVTLTASDFTGATAVLDARGIKRLNLTSATITGDGSDVGITPTVNLYGAVMRESEA